MRELKKCAKFAAVFIGVVVVIAWTACYVSQSAPALASTASDTVSSTQAAPPCWHKLLSWPEGITAWAILLTLGAIIWQAWETRKAAQAALRQLKHMETTERAWLTINFVSMKDQGLKDGEVPTGRWMIKNVGATPAILLETKTRFQVFRLYDGIPDDPAKTLPEIPDYGIPVSINERRLAPQDSIGYFTKWETKTDEEFSEFSFPSNTSEMWMVIAYGFVKYRDTFGEWRESRTCDFTLIGKKDHIFMDFQPHPKVPAAYNRCT